MRRLGDFVWTVVMAAGVFGFAMMGVILLAYLFGLVIP